MSRMAGRFTRVESRRRPRRLVLGLLSDLPRKNCWTIAEWAGVRTPDGMQHLLGIAKWDADQVRDEVGDYVVEHLHDDEAVLVVDETGDVKKGTDTVGVQRQYTGTAGRVENAQVAVYLVTSAAAGTPQWTGNSMFCVPGPPIPTAAGPSASVTTNPPWSRWVTLAMLAHAFLAVLRANEHEGHPSPDELIPLTCDEVQPLFITLVDRTVFDPVHRLRWSVWRRRHQARSQASHYRRQAAQA